jgi:hypothetical protein
MFFLKQLDVGQSTKKGNSSSDISLLVYKLTGKYEESSCCCCFPGVTTHRGCIFTAQ